MEGEGAVDGEAEHPRRIRSSRVGPAKESPKFATQKRAGVMESPALYGVSGPIVFRGEGRPNEAPQQ